MEKRGIGSIRKQLNAAKASLQYHGVPPYYSALAEMTKIPENSVRHILRFERPQWKAELSVVDGHSDNWNKRLIYGLYEFAAKLLLSTEDLLPSPVYLGELLQLTPHHVRNYMRLHKDLAAKIKFVSDVESKIYQAVQRVSVPVGRINCQDVANATGLNRATVYLRVTKQPELYGIGVDVQGPFRKSIRTGVTRGPPIPPWLTGTKNTCAKGFPAFVLLQDRIITTVAQRYGFTYEELTTFRRGRPISSGLGFARAIAMYLLLKDTDLTTSQVGKLFSHRRPCQVLQAQGLILKDVRRTVVKRELQVLRNRYFR